MAKANIEQRAIERYGDDEVARIAVELGKQIGGFAAEDELDDPEYVNDLAEVILSVAPHQALVAAFKEISDQQDATIEQLVTLFGKTRIAEMASYGQIAAERVKSVKELKDVISKPDVEESDLQQLIATAPWLIRPDWSALTQNQTLKTFRDRFIIFWKTTYDEDVDIAISFERKRPDFTFIQHGNKLHVVEIKVPVHKFEMADYARLERYVEAFTSFFRDNKKVSAAFAEGWQIDLVANGVNLTNTTQRLAFESFVQDGRVVRQTWDDFLASAVTAHEEFLAAYDQAHAEEAES
jgi:hypothetical protein